MGAAGGVGRAVVAIVLVAACLEVGFRVGWRVRGRRILGLGFDESDDAFEGLFQAGDAFAGVVEALVEEADLARELFDGAVGEGRGLFEAVDAGRIVGGGHVIAAYQGAGEGPGSSVLGGVGTLSRMARICMGTVVGWCVAAAVCAEAAGGLRGLEAFRYEPGGESDAAVEADGPEAASDLSLDGAMPRFGREGSWWWSVGGAYAHDFDDANGFNINGAVTYFVIEDVEITFELGGWYHDQEGEDAWSVNPSFVFRWHALHDEEKDWTVYVDTGIGVLIASDQVPDGGTEFNFMPRVGAGFTARLGESNARLMAGVRWHHISNARIKGEARNPSRDGVAVYTSVVFPF